MATEGIVTIALNAATSDAILLGGANLIAVQIPGAMTGTSLKVQAQFGPNDDWDDLYYEGVLVSVPATVSTKQKFRPGAMVGLYAVRLVSSANELAARTIGIAVEGLV